MVGVTWTSFTCEGVRLVHIWYILMSASQIDIVLPYERIWNTGKMGISSVSFLFWYYAIMWENLKYRHDEIFVNVISASILCYYARIWNTGTMRFLSMSLLLRYCDVMGFPSVSLLLRFCSVMWENLKYQHNKIPISVTPTSILCCHVRKFEIPAQ